jgi:hypothetical protein
MSSPQLFFMNSDRTIIKRRVLKKQSLSCGLDAYGLVQSPMAGSFEPCNETSGSVKFGELLD